MAQNIFKSLGFPIEQAAVAEENSREPGGGGGGGGESTDLSPVTLTFSPAQVLNARLLADDTDLPARGYSGGPGPGFTMTATGNGALTVDSVLAANGDRILALIQTGSGSNPSRPAVGLYTVIDKGSAGTPWILTRATDFDETSEVIFNTQVDIAEGTTYGGTSYVLSRSGTLGVNIDAGLKMNWVVLPTILLDLLSFLIQDLHAQGNVTVDGNITSRSLSVTEDVGVGGQLAAGPVVSNTGGFLTDGGVAIPNDLLSAIPDASGGVVIDAEARAAINALLAGFRDVLISS